MPIHFNIDAHRTIFLLGERPRSPVQIELPWGRENLARVHLKHVPPSAADLESAIEAVEDALMPLVPHIRGETRVTTSDEATRALIELARNGRTYVPALDIEEMEAVFNRLVNVANGRPVQSEGLPSEPRFAPHLLILRELMHHAEWKSIAVVDASGLPAALAR